MSTPLLANQDSPNVTDWLARADADFAGRRIAEAIDGYRKVLSAHPRDVRALRRLSLAYVHINDFDQAYAHIQLALTAAPKNAELWEHAGLIAASRHEYVCAEAFYCRAIDIAGSTATLHRNLADCLRLSGRLVEAMVQYKRAVEIEPELHHAVRALAAISSELGRGEDAARYWIRAWKLDSTLLSDGLDLIRVLAKLERRDEVNVVVANIRSSFASHAVALKELAYTLNCIDYFHEAIGVAKQGIAIDPENALLHHNATYAYAVLGQFTEMRTHSIEAAALWAHYPSIQFNLATTQLLFGEFKDGWKQYRWHEQLPGNEDLINPVIAEWTGEPLAGRQFLLIGEQGLGDEIQFLRMADWLHRQGATVDVWVHPPLAELAANATGVRAAFDAQPSGHYDYWSRMFKMPEYMNLDVPMLPITMPYLAAKSEKICQWRTYLNRCSPPDIPRKQRIGLVWAGNPEYVFDRYRSMNLDTLRSLFTHPGVTWFSLQKGHRELQGEDLANEVELHLLGPAIKNFTDTLAILQQLDLLITVDTSCAHLAGAAGCPVWVLVPTCTDWRWMLDRTDSPWYPSMRLFRQRKLGDWGSVIDDVKKALQEWCEGEEVKENPRETG
ncbi:MAG: tetratricopeptide repeat-containing glycosyltransferase family protein [Paraburkholderia sp.]|uniref:hypothetical protein n=1 Tax=Paraburkholderia sp. TaxID=1926495 RepID=UPI003C4D8333